MTVHHVGVVGCGLMGSGIAEVCALATLDVVVHELDEPAILSGRGRIERSLMRGVAAGKLTTAAKDAALQRIRFTDDLSDFHDRELVVEAVAEDEVAKTEVFSQLGKVTSSDAILASNTSSIPIIKLAMAANRPGSVVGLHFFNPVPVLNLVELVASLVTTEETVKGARDFAERQLSKRVVASPDRAGFIVNALLIPYILLAIRMFESGFAAAEDIDVGMVEGCNHPMGPLALADFIGLDTTQAIAKTLYEEFKDPLYAPPPLLSRMVDAGLLGRKTGQGFYAYER